MRETLMKQGVNELINFITAAEAHDHAPYGKYSNEYFKPGRSWKIILVQGNFLLSYRK